MNALESTLIPTWNNNSLIVSPSTSIMTAPHQITKNEKIHKRSQLEIHCTFMTTFVQSNAFCKFEQCMNTV